MYISYQEETADLVRRILVEYEGKQLTRADIKVRGGLTVFLSSFWHLVLGPSVQRSSAAKSSPFGLLQLDKKLQLFSKVQSSYCRIF